MSFWGIEVKPGKPHPFHSDNVEGRLFVTQATIGLGSSTERNILQCSVGNKSPVFLCSLLPDRIESCSLNLEFKDELVAFSVIGSRSIHLSGYFVSDEGDSLRDEYEFGSGEDIDGSDTEDSSVDYDDDDEDEDEDEDEYDNDFIDDDDDFEILPSSPVPDSGVVIEEIVDDDKPTNENGQSKGSKKKNNKSSDREDQNNSKKQIVFRKASDTSAVESEDEDGFPIDASQKSKHAIQELDAGKEATKETKRKPTDSSDDVAGKKRKVESAEQDVQPERKKKDKKKKDKGKGANNDENDIPKDDIQNEKVNKQRSPVENKLGQRSPDAGENNSDKKKKNKKNKDTGENVSKDQTTSVVGDEAQPTLDSQDEQSSAKSSHVRNFSNGLVIEELAMGKPDGKKASPGSQVSVHYIGKLKKNGKIFDSNVGRAPFKFRLGVGQVIKGWDVGVQGMRIGDKRRLTIPPSMGYGDRGAGKAIPLNSWLVFDVELVNV